MLAYFTGSDFFAAANDDLICRNPEFGSGSIQRVKKGPRCSRAAQVAQQGCGFTLELRIAMAAPQRLQRGQRGHPAAQPGGLGTDDAGTISGNEDAWQTDQFTTN